MRFRQKVANAPAKHREFSFDEIDLQTLNVAHNAALLEAVLQRAMLRSGRPATGSMRQEWNSHAIIARSQVFAAQRKGATGPIARCMV